MPKRLLKSVLIAGVITGMSAVALSAAAAQQPASSHRAVGDTSIFAPLDLYPPPTAYRTAAGTPGPRYWQNHADYTLHATLDTAAKTVSGTMTLRYVNHSPDTLRFIWVQTEQNAFEPNSLNSMVYAEGSRFGARNFAGGDVIEQFTQAVGKKQVKLDLHDHGTVTKVDLAQPLAPGRTAIFQAAWHFKVPEHGADRMGRDGTLYEIAQWYPRVCVYDDVSGWNTDPYLGQGEFYLEYGNFTLSVTVPAGYIVAATGTLQNPRQVLTTAEISRLAKARKSPTPISIISAAELASGAARPTHKGMLTWTFSAHNVRDAVWAASPEYEWDASSWHGILAQGYYRQSAPVWAHGEAADQARMSIEEYSTRWFQYPYPQISVVEGPVSGMEYPMLAMEAASQDKPGLYNVITHEVGHNWFPMIVGSNERLHFWQDEGFNTFINYFSEARRYPQNGTELERAARDRESIEQTQRGNFDIPIEIPADRIDPRKLGFTEYVKTAVGLQLLREQILGPDTFDAAFRTYIRRWAFKHPTPADFFRTMDNAAGRRLDWFWREWFYDDAHFDQAIDTVAYRMAGDTDRVAIRYENNDRGVLPILVRFTFTDGTTKDFSYPAEVWSMNTHDYVRHYAFPARTVARIDLDPDSLLVDDDRGNNTWISPDAPGAVGTKAKAQAAARDSATMLLTANDLERYIAVRQALGSYWKAHAAQFQSAQQNAQVATVSFGGQELKVGTLDYAALVKQDSSLAAIFTKNDFPIAQLQPTSMAVYQALIAVALHQEMGAPLPPDTTVIGKNAALVTAHQKELAAVGLALRTNGDSGDDLQP
ncbi:MAG TPA: M1 family metallopeptidase [Gemmatimonadaceae bacterium]